VGRIPLKTRGREDEIAGSGILLIDSGWRREQYPPGSEKNRRKALSIVTGYGNKADCRVMVQFPVCR
jgi:hypothetical protein